MTAALTCAMTEAAEEFKREHRFSLLRSPNPRVANVWEPRSCGGVQRRPGHLFRRDCSNRKAKKLTKDALARNKVYILSNESHVLTVLLILVVCFRQLRFEVRICQLDLVPPSAISVLSRHITLAGPYSNQSILGISRCVLRQVPRYLVMLQSRLESLVDKGR